MDDAIDQMQETVKAIMLFEMTEFEPEMREMADAIVDSAELVQRAIPLLSTVGNNAAALNEICLQINNIEGRTDSIYDRGLKALYQKAKAGDALEFIRGSEIYKHLEESVDRFDDVANEIQGIVIEHLGGASSCRASAPSLSISLSRPSKAALGHRGQLRARRL